MKHMVLIFQCQIGPEQEYTRQHMDQAKYCLHLNNHLKNRYKFIIIDKLYCYYLYYNIIFIILYYII